MTTGAPIPQLEALEDDELEALEEELLLDDELLADVDEFAAAVPPQPLTFANKEPQTINPTRSEPKRKLNVFMGTPVLITYRYHSKAINVEILAGSRPIPRVGLPNREWEHA